ncbi:MAG: hypothetical protein J6Y20_08540 [Lachnospiraceae bacterium]|nr:hypothetical protein [Lachnospiraceae bacterium]
MKKVLVLFLVLVLVLSVVACGSDDKDGDSKKDDKKNESSTNNDNKKDDNKKEEGKGGGEIVAVIGDKHATAETSQARTYWHAVSSSRNFEFDADGKCVKNETIYVVDDPANYGEANEYLIGLNYAPVWSSDKTTFTLDEGFLKNTDTAYALEYFDKRFYAYTIKYGNGTEKRVEEPDDAAKMVKMKEVFGFSLDDAKGALGAYTVNSWQRDSVSILMGENSTVDDVNALCAKIFEICKPLAEGGTMYDWLGKYGETITEAPVTSSEFDDATFHYFYGGKEIKVSIGISQKLNKVLTFTIGIAS